MAGTRRAWGALAAIGLTAAAACVPPQTADRSQCVPLFEQYDRVGRLNPELVQNIGERRTLWGSEIDRLGRLLVINDCQTRPGDVAAPLPAAGPIRQAGAPLGRLVAIHVGAFTSQADADGAIGLFRAAGLKALSLGDPRLGRRVYVGPVTTQGELESVLATAFAAGYVASYPSEFFRF